MRSRRRHSSSSQCGIADHRAGNTTGIHQREMIADQRRHFARKWLALESAGLHDGRVSICRRSDLSSRPTSIASIAGCAQITRLFLRNGYSNAASVPVAPMTRPGW